MKKIFAFMILLVAYMIIPQISAENKDFNQDQFELNVSTFNKNVPTWMKNWTQIAQVVNEASQVYNEDKQFIVESIIWACKNNTFAESLPKLSIVKTDEMKLLVYIFTWCQEYKIFLDVKEKKEKAVEDEKLDSNDSLRRTCNNKEKWYQMSKAEKAACYKYISDDFSRLLKFLPKFNLKIKDAWNMIQFIFVVIAILCRSEFLVSLSRLIKIIQTRAFFNPQIIFSEIALVANMKVDKTPLGVFMSLVLLLTDYIEDIPQCRTIFHMAVVIVTLLYYFYTLSDPRNRGNVLLLSFSLIKCIKVCLLKSTDLLDVDKDVALVLIVLRGFVYCNNSLFMHLEVASNANQMIYEMNEFTSMQMDEIVRLAWYIAVASVIAKCVILFFLLNKFPLERMWPNQKMEVLSIYLIYFVHLSSCLEIIFFSTIACYIMKVNYKVTTYSWKPELFFESVINGNRVDTKEALDILDNQVEVFSRAGKGTGVIVENDNKAMILTKQHIDSDGSGIWSVTSNGRRYEAKKVKQYIGDDPIILLETEKLPMKKKARVRKTVPTNGNATIATVRGMQKNRFDVKEGQLFYTIDTEPGDSGAGVYYEGELIGIHTAATHQDINVGDLIPGDSLF